jgi:hypothetical protein
MHQFNYTTCGRTVCLEVVERRMKRCSHTHDIGLGFPHHSVRTARWNHPCIMHVDKGRTGNRCESTPHEHISV